MRSPRSAVCNAGVLRQAALRIENGLCGASRTKPTARKGIYNVSQARAVSRSFSHLLTDLVNRMQDHRTPLQTVSGSFSRGRHVFPRASCTARRIWTTRSYLRDVWNGRGAASNWESREQRCSFFT